MMHWVKEEEDLWEEARSNLVVIKMIWKLEYKLLNDPDRDASMYSSQSVMKLSLKKHLSATDIAESGCTSRSGAPNPYIQIKCLDDVRRSY